MCRPMAKLGLRPFELAHLGIWDPLKDTKTFLLSLITQPYICQLFKLGTRQPGAL